jgi:ribosomal protein S9
MKYKGIPLELGGVTYEVPPLALGDLELLQEQLEAFNGAGGAIDRAMIRTVVDATHAALRRNYPEVSRDQVAAMLDLSNMFEVMAAVMDVSGVGRKAREEAARPGEARPVTESTGSASTPAS